MSLSVPNGWYVRFTPMLLHTMQQERSLVVDKLLPRARRTGPAAMDTWERIGNVLLSPVGRHTQTVQLNPSHTRRAVVPQTLGGGILTSPNVDLPRMLLNPVSDYRQMLAAAAIQARDKFVLDGSIGTATTVTVSPTTAQLSYGSQAMLTSRVTGNGATAINLTKVIAAGVLLTKASVPRGAENRVFFYAPGQEEGLLEITQASSSDFTNNRIHDKGTMDGINWEGFDFTLIPDVLDETTATLVNMLPLSTADRTNIAMYKGGVGFSEMQAITPRLSERSDLNHETQAYISFTAGAVRLFEGAVVETHSLEE